jgi:hypothetical protein
VWDGDLKLISRRIDCTVSQSSLFIFGHTNMLLPSELEVSERGRLPCSPSILTEYSCELSRTEGYSLDVFVSQGTSATSMMTGICKSYKNEEDKIAGELAARERHLQLCFQLF